MIRQQAQLQRTEDQVELALLRWAMGSHLWLLAEKGHHQICVLEIRCWQHGWWVIGGRAQKEP